MIGLDQAEAGRERASLEPGLPAGPEAGFYGRDETLLALDRAFDTHAGRAAARVGGRGEDLHRGSSSPAGTRSPAPPGVLFTSFTHHLPLARLLDQIGDHYGPALAQARSGMGHPR